MRRRDDAQSSAVFTSESGLTKPRRAHLKTDKSLFADIGKLAGRDHQAFNANLGRQMRGHFHVKW